MFNIEYSENTDEALLGLLDAEFEKFAAENCLVCNYIPFNFVAGEGDKIVGILSGNSYYEEVHVSDLIVLPQYRNQHIGSKLLKQCENHFKDKGFENINLTTYAFQAPEFYKKLGYNLEFIQENKRNPKLTKYFYTKRFI